MADPTKEVLDEMVKMARGSIGGQAITDGGVPFALVPSGYTLESMEKLIYNDHQPSPERIKANVTATDAETFVNYWTLFGDENSRAFASEENAKVFGILDYHENEHGDPRWCQHRVTLCLRESPEWKAWAGKNGQHFSQIAFAEFLEQHAVDIGDPGPAAMLEVARDLDATTEVEFGSSSRNENGQIRIKYTETVKATVGGGSMQVPERFTLNIPVFIGGAPIPVAALLRYRIKEGKLVLWYTLVRPEAAQRAAFIASRDAIASKLGIVILNGSHA